MNGSDLIFNGEIVLEGDVLPHEWCMWPDDSCFSARMVREALAQFSGDVTIRVNSPGGSPHEGEAVRAAIEAHPGKVTVVVAGIAASASSLLIMAADRIEVTAGSFIMLHDPSTCICGNPDQLRAEADVLDVLSDTYAQVYAARTGQTVEAIRAMMKKEVWLGPDQAIAAGFADAIAGADPAPADIPADLAAAMSAHTTTLSTLRMCAAKANAAPDTPAGNSTGRSGQSPAMSATTLETDMPPEIEEQNAAPAVATPVPPATPTPAAPVTTMSAPTPPAPDTQAVRDQAMRDERDRARSIREMSAPFMASGQLTQADVDAVINDGTPLQAASGRLMTAMAAAQPPVAPTPGGIPARVRGGDQRDPQMEGMIAALMRDFSGPGAEYRGMRLSGLAMTLSGTSRGYSDVESMRRGMMATTMMGGAHGVSDFAYITTEVMNRTLIAEYERRTAQWSLVTGEPLTASDFRELHAARFGGDFQLKPVQANGEYQQAVLADEAEGLKVERRGREIAITFEAVVNDDMGAFTRIPREFAMAARMMEASMVWSLIRSNAVLKSDSKALFHADHGNLNAGGAGVISASTVGAARKAMWEQRAFGSKDKDDFLNLTPDTLLVPPALELAAGQFVRPTTPAKDSDGNPYKDTLTPHTVPNLGAAATGGSDTAWYLVSSDLPPVSVARLEGYEAPTVQTMEGMNPDLVKMTARHMFGAANTEFRGVQKNNGA